MPRNCRSTPSSETCKSKSADLDTWERQLNQRGIDNADKGIEEVFP
jgi:hypothetical protein